MKDTGLMLRLKALKNYINQNTYRTIKGQIINGDVEGAAKGIERIEKTLKKSKKNAERNEYGTMECKYSTKM